MTKPTALISGISGFIASHVCQYLLEQTDWNIVGIEGFSYAAKPSRLLDLDCWQAEKHRVRLFYHDLRAPIPDHLIESIGPITYLLSIASESHVDRSISEPATVIQTNVAIAVNTLEYARKIKPETVVQFSTDETYGPLTEEHPQPFTEWERYIPSNPYSASKASQDMIATAYWRTYNLPIIITNTMNVFGPSQDREKFIPLCINKLISGKPVPVHGEQLPDGSWQAGTRYWLHARNVADALLFLLRNVQPALYHSGPDGIISSNHAIRAFGTNEVML